MCTFPTHRECGDLLKDCLTLTKKDTGSDIAKHHFVQHLPHSLYRVSSSKKIRRYNASDMMVGSSSESERQPMVGVLLLSSSVVLFCPNPNIEEPRLILFNSFRPLLIVIRCSIKLITNIDCQKALRQLHCPKLRLQRLNNFFPILMIRQ